MASRKSLHNAKQNYIYPTVISSSDDNTDIEFNESDLYWNNSSSSSSESTVVIITKNIDRLIQTSAVDRRGDNNRVPSASSVPVNIPDWSKILMTKKDGWGDDDEEGDDVTEMEINGGDYEGRWVPPHEYLARRRGASFSVQEGIGRTLKGSDLRRVRNAIWKKVGFED